MCHQRAKWPSYRRCHRNKKHIQARRITVQNLNHTSVGLLLAHMGDDMRLKRRSAVVPHAYVTVSVQKRVAQFRHATERTISDSCWPEIVRSIACRSCATRFWTFIFIHSFDLRLEMKTAVSRIRIRRRYTTLMGLGATLCNLLALGRRDGCGCWSAFIGIFTYVKNNHVCIVL